MSLDGPAYAPWGGYVDLFPGPKYLALYRRKTKKPDPPGRRFARAGADAGQIGTIVPCYMGAAQPPVTPYSHENARGHRPGLLLCFATFVLLLCTGCGSLQHAVCDSGVNVSGR